MAFISTHPVGDGNPADADLTTRIALALIAHQRTGWRRIHLIVQHGAVTLLGEVSTFFNRQLAVAITQHVAGVIRVEDELTVTNRPSCKSDGNEREVEFSSQNASAESGENRPNNFARIPVLAESLEDILAGHERSAAVA